MGRNFNSVFEYIVGSLDEFFQQAAKKTQASVEVGAGGADIRVGEWNSEASQRFCKD